VVNPVLKEVLSINLDHTHNKGGGNTSVANAFCFPKIATAFGKEEFVAYNKAARNKKEECTAREQDG
jgi:hypothetical protein